MDSARSAGLKARQARTSSSNVATLLGYGTRSSLNSVLLTWTPLLGTWMDPFWNGGTSEPACKTQIDEPWPPLQCWFLGQSEMSVTLGSSVARVHHPRSSFGLSSMTPSFGFLRVLKNWGPLLYASSCHAVCVVTCNTLKLFSLI